MAAEAIRKVKSSEARTSPTLCMFMPKVGYTKYPAIMNEPQTRSVKTPHHALIRGTLNTNCEAPAGTKPGSQHYLLPPGGHKSILCEYVANGPAWMPVNRDGKRMAFTAAYLGSHGWKYGKAA